MNRCEEETWCWRVARLGTLAGLTLVGACDRTLEATDDAEDTAVVARVGRQAIRAEALRRVWRKLPPERMRELERDAEHRRQLLEPLVRDQVLYEEALRRDVLSRPEAADQVRRLAVRALKRELLAEAGGSGDPSDAAVRAAYEKEAGRYRRAARVRAMAIFVDSRDKAEQIHAEVLDKPHDPHRFAQLVAKHSLHAESKRRAGDLGLLTPDGSGASAKLVRAALSVKEPLGLAPVFHDGAYWVVLVKTAEIPGFEVPFERARQGIRQRLAREQREQWVDDYIDQLRRRAAVSIDEAALAKICTSKPD